MQHFSTPTKSLCSKLPHWSLEQKGAVDAKVSIAERKVVLKARVTQCSCNCSALERALYRRGITVLYQPESLLAGHARQQRWHSTRGHFSLSFPLFYSPILLAFNANIALGYYQYRRHWFSVLVNHCYFLLFAIWHSEQNSHGASLLQNNNRFI